jgi:Sec-independent protein translocase protein TatA
MDILGIGPMELFFIVLLALVILGPKDMIKAGNSIGRFLRRTVLSPEWLNIQRTVRTLPSHLMKEAGIEEKDLQIRLDEDTGKQPVTEENTNQNNVDGKIAQEWLTPPSEPDAVQVDMESDGNTIDPAGQAASHPEAENSESESK